MMELHLLIIALQVILIVLISWNLWRSRGHSTMLKRLRRMTFLMRQIVNGESGSYWNDHLKELADIERELSS